MGNCDSEHHGHGHDHGHHHHHGMSDEERFDRFYNGSFKRYLGKYNSCMYKNDFIILTRDLVREFNGRYVPEERILESWHRMTGPSGNLSEGEFYKRTRPELKEILREYQY